MRDHYLLTYGAGSQYHAQVTERGNLYHIWLLARQGGESHFSAFRLLPGKQPQRVRVDALESGGRSYLLLYDIFGNLIDTVCD